ncbi:MAG TPA: hypothetical protein VE090_03460 [Methylomirabilota bacterium]|nr:hypothetical protein [Methylomirabilota bacterium]
MSEKNPHSSMVEVTTSHHMSKRRFELNRRLRKWGTWFVGGVAAEVVGVLLLSTVPVIAAPLMLGGIIAEAVGFVGVAGNVIKGIVRK